MTRSRVRPTVDLTSTGKRRGFCLVPHSSNMSAYGSVAVPIGVIANGEGPSILLTAGLHGDEYEGQIALDRLFRSIELENVTGRILILPKLNIAACQAGSRLSPIDGLNLNRIFPGEPDGSPSRQIAWYLDEVLVAQVDVWIDLHSGGKSLDYLPLVARHKAEDPSLDARGNELLRVFGGDHALVWDGFDEPRMAKSSAERHGVAYLASELGGGGRADRRGIALAYEGVSRVLRHQGILRPTQGVGAGSPPDVYRVDDREDYYVAEERGYFIPMVELGDDVSQGDLLGEIFPGEAFVSSPVEVVARAAGRVLCLRAIAETEPGDLVAHLGRRGSADQA